MRRPERALAAVAVWAALGGGAVAAPEATGDAPLGLGKLAGRKEPITITADTLEYDYKGNVVVYRGGVQAHQGDVKLKSDLLTVRLAGRPKDSPAPPPPADAAPADGDAKVRVESITATGNVRIDQGARWATGGRAVFDQKQRTLVLSESPVLHDGPNEVAGDRVVVFLDEDRSVVEGGRKRVKAVLYPEKGGGLAPDAPARARAGGQAAADGAEARAPGASEAPAP